MQNIAVFADDAEYAQHLLQPMLNESVPTRWLVVVCAPLLTHRISKWVSHSAREQWRTKWAAKLFESLEPVLKAQPGASIEMVIAKGPLTGVCKQLRSRFPDLRVLDARRPKMGRAAEPLDPQQPPARPPGWACPIAVTSGLSLVLALAD